MTVQIQPHRTRGHRPGFQPIALTDITIRIQAAPGVNAEVWQEVNTEVYAAIEASLAKHGLVGLRHRDG